MSTTVPLLINEGSFPKASAPPLFLEDENFFQNRPPWFQFYCDSAMNHGGRFLKNVLIFEKKHEKKGGAHAFENDPPFTIIARCIGANPQYSSLLNLVYPDTCTRRIVDSSRHCTFELDKVLRQFFSIFRPVSYFCVCNFLNTENKYKCDLSVLKVAHKYNA